MAGVGLLEAVGDVLLCRIKKNVPTPASATTPSATPAASQQRLRCGCTGLSRSVEARAAAFGLADEAVAAAGRTARATVVSEVCCLFAKLVGSACIACVMPTIGLGTARPAVFA